MNTNEQNTNGRKQQTNMNNEQNNNTNEVFSTDMQMINTVEVVINGASIGQIEVADNARLGAFVVEQARNAGIRSFSVYVDGNKAVTSDSNKLLADVKSIAIVAKENRG